MSSERINRRNKKNNPSETSQNLNHLQVNLFDVETPQAPGLRPSRTEQPQTTSEPVVEPNSNPRFTQAQGFAPRTAPSQPKAKTNQDIGFPLTAEGTDRIGGAGAERGDASEPSTSPRKEPVPSDLCIHPVEPSESPSKPVKPVKGQPIPERPTTQAELKKWNETHQPKPIKLIAKETPPVECELGHYPVTQPVWDAPSTHDETSIKCYAPRDFGMKLHWMDKPFTSRDPYELHECQRDWYRFHNEVCIRFPWLLSHPPQPID
jgi:hypothetical protein